MPNFNLTDASGLRIIVGHVGRNPELKFTTGGKKLAKFSVATNRKGADGNVTTDWHNVTAWDDEADAAMQLLAKGRVACIVGKESKREYQGKTYVEINAYFVGVGVRPERPANNGQHERLPEQGPRAEQDIPF
jgi:single-strand DNA-binding protein